MHDRSPWGRSTLTLLAGVGLAGLGAFVGCGGDEEPGGERAPEPDATVDAAPPLEAGPALDASRDAAPDAAPPDAGDCVQDASNTAPAELRCTGLYADFASKTVAASARAYEPAVVLWSDGAEKHRWVSLPPGTQIDTTNMDEWKFPLGTRFWKEFSLGGKRIETRFYWKVSEFLWVRTTYRWSDDETTATRLDVGFSENDAGDPAASGYEIPAVAKCDQCHGGSADRILGFEAVGLGLPGATGLTLGTLVAEGLLTVNPPKTELAVPDDGLGAAASLGWLHANCGTSCHNALPQAMCAFKGMHVQLSFAETSAVTPLTSLEAYVTTVGVASSIPSGGYQRIQKGNAGNSAVHWLMSHRDATNLNGQMPPSVSHRVDEPAAAALAAWIDALP